MDGQPLSITSRSSIPFAELAFHTSRSGGPGGQNVNKVETKVEVRFDVKNSPSLTDAQRSQIFDRLRGRIDSSGVLRVTVQRSRSQYQNKVLAVERLSELLRNALHPRPQRVRTRPSKTSADMRIQQKKRHSEKKRLRKVNSD